ncbi:hypothetical protein P8625_00900 [Tenacibaculum tangerinum]|uniref:Lipoprotein n=1 Tax=Tenacibaculum tangerinum TaxID=3038772 RepID=A0ABY8L554_9FLAO|nr:hypothetical protein [Tenacibaculum tangerinum]WGH75752.1 hypothetical protein P8625_00900 [Tenacibaculum tangerinum]
MNRILSLLICVFLVTSCGNKREGEQKTGLLSNFISITDNEDAGVKEILEFYGGQCKYAIGVSASTKDGKKKYFELEMSKSGILEDNANRIEMPASNIAYLFYRNLKEEKENYDEIHSIIVFEDGTKKTFEYSTETLELVDERMSLVNHTVDLLTKKDYESLKLLLNTELFEFDKNEFLTNIKKFEPQLGKIKEFRPFGFRIREAKNGINLLHVSGALIRKIQNNEFSVDMDLNSGKQELYLLQYKL